MTAKVLDRKLLTRRYSKIPTRLDVVLFSPDTWRKYKTKENKILEQTSELRKQTARTRSRVLPKIFSGYQLHSFSWNWKCSFRKTRSLRVLNNLNYFSKPLIIFRWFCDETEAQYVYIFVINSQIFGFCWKISVNSVVVLIQTIILSVLPHFISPARIIIIVISRTENWYSLPSISIASFYFFASKSNFVLLCVYAQQQDFVGSAKFGSFSIDLERQFSEK